MIITKAEFEQSVTTIEQCPKNGYPEFAFIGRSNVGKSSLINMLTGNSGLAKTSQTPGKTQTINHFNINNHWYLVDLPGYGYAKTSRQMRKDWDTFIRQYILQRHELVNLFVLIDSRHEPQKNDLEFTNWLGNNSIPFSLVFTKIDKLSSSKLNKNLSIYKTRLSEEWETLPPIFTTSAEAQYGRNEILNYIETILDTIKNRLPIYKKS